MKISENEAIAFHQSHFSADAVTNFATSFTNLPPRGEEPILYHPHGGEDEDDLGFYHDGVKRTLTDEQIEIFRHSELRELQKRQEKAKVSKSKANSESESTERNGSMDASSQDAHAHGSRGVKKKKKKMKKGGRYAGYEPKPDLRKRTWDVVDAGLDSLNYD